MGFNIRFFLKHTSRFSSFSFRCKIPQSSELYLPINSMFSSPSLYHSLFHPHSLSFFIYLALPPSFTNPLCLLLSFSPFLSPPPSLTHTILYPIPSLSHKLLFLLSQSQFLILNFFSPSFILSLSLSAHIQDYHLLKVNAGPKVH